MADEFSFKFDPRYRGLLLSLGVRPGKSRVIVDDETFKASFGRFRIETPMSNVKCAHVTRNYRAYKAIGVRGSAVDSGVTFGSNTRAGVCVCFHEHVPGVIPLLKRGHAAVTVTVRNPEMLLHALGERGVDISSEE
jgi:tRNA splicing endonuclease